jgi:hypothetical protein
VSTRKKAVRARASEKKPVVIEEVLSEVQKALQEAQSKIQDPDFPKLDSVVLTLQTAITVGVGGKLKFLIFWFGMTWQKEQAQELVLTLTPPPSSVQEQSLSSQLAKAIVEAADGVRKAKTGTPPLDLNSLNVSITFIVTQEVSGGFTLTPVTLDLSGNLKKKALHKIELKFKKK